MPTTQDSESVVVPREATQAMREAATEIVVDDGNGGRTALNWEEAAKVWSAMIAAAPSTSVREEEFASKIGDQYRGRSWLRAVAFADAAAECDRAARETTFADGISEDRRRGYRSACGLIAMSLRHMESRAAPHLLAAPPLASAWEEDARALLTLLVLYDDEAQPRGLQDAVDNTGVPYQSAAMAGLVTAAETLLDPVGLAAQIAEHRRARAAVVPSTDEGTRQ